MAHKPIDMDPALQEILTHSDAVDEIEAIIRLNSPDAGLPGVRIISKFGMIATCRLKKNEIVKTRQKENVKSLKASRLVGPEPHQTSTWQTNNHSTCITDLRRPHELIHSGKGVVVALIDWGLDFCNSSFRNSDGSTRLIALWDQRGKSKSNNPNRYGYGNIYYRDHINTVLQMEDPYAELNYHPADTDPRSDGSHGTHVMDIAAGNGNGGGPVSLAKDADLIFVHLADKNTGGIANLGSSVRILEAIDFISRLAGNKPCVINLSVGRHGGPHDGSTLCEQAFDYFLKHVPNRMIVQSAGNYFDKQIHASGQVKNNETSLLRFIINPGDSTANELEIWYSGKDVLDVNIGSPLLQSTGWVKLGEKADLVFKHSSDPIGRIYHRPFDPNNGDNHIDLFLYPNAPHGIWEIQLRGKVVRYGVFHAWIERDDACPTCQSRFLNQQNLDSFSTTGTLANASLPLIVGAYNHHDKSKTPTNFSSSGPTRDYRSKPDLLAPGSNILAAKSTPKNFENHNRLLIRKSGTSMAAPHVTSVVALCFEQFRKPAWAYEVRSFILNMCDPIAIQSKEVERYGAGFLNVKRVINALNNSVQPLPLPIHPMKTTLEKYLDGAEDTINRSHLPKGDMFDLNARAIYREVSRKNRMPENLREFIIIGKPREFPEGSIQAGDVLIRIGLGEPGFEHVAILAETPKQSIQNGLTVIKEGNLPGWYAIVIEPGRVPHIRKDYFARRILDHRGRVPVGQLIIRQLNTGDNSLQTHLTENESVITDRSSAIGNHLGRRAEWLIISNALNQEMRGENELTNLVFYKRHPELSNKPLDQSHPNYKELSTEWLNIRNKLVRPAIETFRKNNTFLTSTSSIDTSSLRNRIVAIAIGEWNRWGHGSRTEDEPEMKTVITQYWSEGVGNNKPNLDSAWSAVFISWVIRKAGGGDNFKYAPVHTTYTYYAKKNEVDKNDNPFKAYPASKAKPEVGDIVVRNRGGSTFTYDNLKPGEPGTHGDIVVSVGPHSIELIGGNKGNKTSGHKGVTVNKVSLAINDEGYITNKKYFAIIKIREF